MDLSFLLDYETAAAKGLGLIITGAASVMSAVHLYWALRSRMWLPVEGTVSSVKRIEHKRKDGTRYREIKVTYSYRYSSKEFLGTRIGYGFWSGVPEMSGSLGFMLETGSVVQVFLDPGQPRRSVLVKGPDDSNWLALGLSLPLFAVAVLVSVA